MPRFQPKRLLKLANMLIRNARNKKGMRFDLNVVGTPSNGATAFKNEEDLINCGTSGCAMGLAAMSGEFKKEGLTHRIDPNSYKPDIVTVWKGLAASYDGAAVALFGLKNYDTARYLFSPIYTPPGKRKGAIGERFVAGRIRRLVKNKGKIPLNPQAYTWWQ